MNAVISSLILAAASTAHSPFRPLPPEQKQVDRAKDRHGDLKMADPATEDKAKEGRAGLPHAFGKSFRTLDDYLAHLKQYAGPIDLPWWRPVGSDRFEHVTARRMPAAKREIATRAELMQRFGFEK